MLFCYSFKLLAIFIAYHRVDRFPGKTTEERKFFCCWVFFYIYARVSGVIGHLLRYSVITSKTSFCRFNPCRYIIGLCVKKTLSG